MVFKRPAVALKALLKYGDDLGTKIPKCPQKHTEISSLQSQLIQ
jgi:hypothetical protein